MLVTFKKPIFGTKDSVLVAGTTKTGKIIGMSVPKFVADTCKIGEHVTAVAEFVLPPGYCKRYHGGLKQIFERKSYRKVRWKPIVFFFFLFSINTSFGLYIIIMSGIFRNGVPASDRKSVV